MIILNRINTKAQMRPANLFFVELLISLLFFSLSSAIILQVFAAADKKQDNGELTERAIVSAQSVAECYSVTGDISEAVELAFGVRPAAADGALVLLLDNELALSEDGGIKLSLSELSRDISEAGVFTRLSIEYTIGEKELYSLICSAYTPDFGGDADE